MDRDPRWCNRCPIAPQQDVNTFFGNIPKHIADATLIICRSGASTISELAVAGRPALLVPFPYAADDHQRANAETLCDAG